jgi:hypothetical protein
MVTSGSGGLTFSRQAARAPSVMPAGDAVDGVEQRPQPALDQPGQRPHSRSASFARSGSSNIAGRPAQAAHFTQALSGSPGDVWRSAVPSIGS